MLVISDFEQELCSFFLLILVVLESTIALKATLHLTFLCCDVTRASTRVFTIPLPRYVLVHHTRADIIYDICFLLI